MKNLFIEARKKNLPEPELDNLPSRIHLLYSIQYKALAENLKKKLGKKIVACEQVLGCSKINPKADLVFIGDGKFHAFQIAISTGKEILILPSGEKISKEEIEMEKAKEKGRTAKFLISKKIGILFSLKPRQGKLKESLKIRSSLEAKYKDKNFYIFLADNINTEELENFPIDIWLNTACPGLASDSSKIINYEKILNFDF